MSSPRYTSSPNRSKAKDDLQPPPSGPGDCNTKNALNAYSIHVLSTGQRQPVDKSPESFHNPSQLSTESVDNSPKLWITTTRKKERRLIVAFDQSAACG